MEAVPINGATPDIFSSEPFHHEFHDGFFYAVFRDIEPMAARNGAGALVKYPFVLAVIDPRSKKAVYFVTVEVGAMFGTCCLCAFSNSGIHLNLGSWEHSQDSERFIGEAMNKAGEAMVRQAMPVTPQKLTRRFGIF